VTEGAVTSATGEEAVDYRSLVAYSSSLTDTLLFIHYLAVVLIEIRHLQPAYYIKVIVALELQLILKVLHKIMT
jgi:vang-like